MDNLRSTVIMKTDLADFTSRVSKSSQSDLAHLLNVQKDLVSDVVSKNSGSIVKGEGDSFWITFPSVTTAAVSAVEIQQDFHIAQAGFSEEDTLKIRVAITIGDVLHQEGDIFGDAVNLAARIEAVTPAGEIYLSQAAWLVLNKAEIGNSFVNEFDLKGLQDRVRIYRIDQRHKTRIIRDQVVVFTDLMGFGAFWEKYKINDVELMLMQNEEVAKTSCEAHGGTIRSTIGDSHFITFTEPLAAVQAVKGMIEQWEQFLNENEYPCHLAVGVHRGDVSIFRSCIYGSQIHKAAIMGNIIAQINPEKDCSIALISSTIYKDIRNTDIADLFNERDPFETNYTADQQQKHGFTENEKVYEFRV